MKNLTLAVCSLFWVAQMDGQTGKRIFPSNTEVVTPIHKTSFNDDCECPERKQGGNPQMI